MKSRFALLVLCVLAVIVLAGCKSSGGSSGLAGSSFTVAQGGGGDEDGDGGVIATVHNPEPHTFALLGGGLLAYAFIRRRMKK